jgi:hypothetical protein
MALGLSTWSCRQLDHSHPDHKDLMFEVRFSVLVDARDVVLQEADAEFQSAGGRPQL